ncbi:hypothetical protein GCM10011491_45870 [Brucella endophytica]|uniref:Recombinase domain-containing protein n=1 Tax=Brucella endophytica TaxID=1963359 RepID=A0A916SQE4_9HYPH|nr:hypothetical protein GCM10011491_45870 [Brucella endophytica]
MPGIAAPGGGEWGFSTINGNPKRGNGILNNEMYMYIGKLVWNRQRFIKDPDTGKRQARMNPESEWITQEVPELRIIDDALWDETGADAAEALAGNAASDPARQLWNAWQSACLNTVALWEKQQRLETQLVNTIGFPHAKVYLPDEDATFSIWWQGDIGDYFGNDPALADIRAKAEADFAAHQARWDTEDERIGYSAAKRAEHAAADRQEELVEALTDTPATTLAGVRAVRPLRAAISVVQVPIFATSCHMQQSDSLIMRVLRSQRVVIYWSLRLIKYPAISPEACASLAIARE